LTAIILILIVLLAGIAYLVQAYAIGATAPGQPGYQSVLSQLVAAVVGQGVFYYLTIGAILSVLALSANTGFADFPRLCRVIAHDGFLPRLFASRGRRLVYAHGIYALTALSGLILVVFGGITDHLIPLFAVGAFLAFTLSQAGMVAHWKRVGGPRAWRNMLINGTGAVATGITLVVVGIAKFTEGAWVMALLVPVLLAVFGAVRRHYHQVAVETTSVKPLDVTDLRPPIVIIPVNHWNKVAQKGLRFALQLSPDIYVVQILTSDADEDLRTHWAEYVEAPTRVACLPTPQLVQIASPYRHVLKPLLDYVLCLRKQHPARQVAVLIPELVEARWYHNLLHNKRAGTLKALLLLRGDEHIVVINVPWYLSV
jgi:hypothetical protein